MIAITDNKMRQFVRLSLFMGLLYIGGSNDCAEVFTENPYRYGVNIRITFINTEKHCTGYDKLGVGWLNTTTSKYQVFNPTGRNSTLTIINATDRDEGQYRCCCDEGCSPAADGKVVVIAKPVIRDLNRQLDVANLTYRLPMGATSWAFSCTGSPQGYYDSVKIEHTQNTRVQISQVDSGNWNIIVDGSERNDGLLIKCVVSKEEYSSTQELTLHFYTLTTAPDKNNSPEESTSEATKRESASEATNRAEPVTKSTSVDKDVVVIAAASAGAGVVLIVAIVVTVLCLKQRRKQASKFRKDPSNGAPVRSEDQTASTNAALLDKKEGADTADEYTYASVVPKSQRTKTVDTKIDSSARADLDSIVSSKSDRQDRLPEQQTSSDTGLMYVELDLTASAAGTGTAPQKPRDNATTEQGVEYGEIDFSK